MTDKLNRRSFLAGATAVAAAGATLPAVAMDICKAPAKWDETFDVIVIGAGHAGIEAAHAAATLGARTAVFTMSLDAIGNMPCNPSIGGTAKGTVTRSLRAVASTRRSRKTTKRRASRIRLRCTRRRRLLQATSAPIRRL